jgi:hypothetical protein
MELAFLAPLVIVSEVGVSDIAGRLLSAIESVRENNPKIESGADFPKILHESLSEMRNFAIAATLKPATNRNASGRLLFPRRSVPRETSMDPDRRLTPQGS